MKRLLILPVLLVAGGCAALTPPAAQPSPDQCGAAGAQSLIGSHAGAVTFPADKPVRLVCTTCPTTFRSLAWPRSAACSSPAAASSPSISSRRQRHLLASS